MPMKCSTVYLANLTLYDFLRLMKRISVKHAFTVPITYLDTVTNCYLLAFNYLIIVQQCLTNLIIQSYVMLFPQIIQLKYLSFSKTLRETLYQKLDHDHNETDYQMRLLTDELSDALIPQDIAINDIMALKTTGDGNCLFHAASLALTGM